MPVLPAGYHGYHVPAARPDHDSLDWRPADAAQRYSGIRVREQTCGLDACARESYELCHAGGQAFIRRTGRGRRGVVTVAETDPMPVRQAERVWVRLLTGQAR